MKKRKAKGIAHATFHLSSPYFYLSKLFQIMTTNILAAILTTPPPHTNSLVHKWRHVEHKNLLFSNNVGQSSQKLGAFKKLA